MNFIIIASLVAGFVIGRFHGRLFIVHYKELTKRQTNKSNVIMRNLMRHAVIVIAALPFAYLGVNYLLTWAAGVMLGFWMMILRSK